MNKFELAISQGRLTQVLHPAGRLSFYVYNTMADKKRLFRYPPNHMDDEEVVSPTKENRRLVEALSLLDAAIIRGDADDYGALEGVGEAYVQGDYVRYTFDYDFIKEGGIGDERKSMG